MNNLLNLDRYPEPETEYETYEDTVFMSHVRAGDILAGTALPVGRRKSGTKWTELFSENEVKIARRLNTDQVVVIRERETAESKAASDRAFRNQRLIRKITEHDPTAALVEHANTIASDVTQYSCVTYSDVSSLIKANAKAQVEREFFAAVEARASQDDFTGDLVDVLDEFVAYLTERVMGKARYASNRSTNAVSNLMDDELLSAMAEFVENVRFYW